MASKAPTHMKKKIVDIDLKHDGWIKQTATELDMFERDVLWAVIEYAMTHNVMAAHKQKTLENALERSLSQMSAKAIEVADLKEKTEKQLRELRESKAVAE